MYKYFYIVAKTGDWLLGVMADSGLTVPKESNGTFYTKIKRHLIRSD